MPAAGPVAQATPDELLRTASGAYAADVVAFVSRMLQRIEANSQAEAAAYLRLVDRLATMQATQLSIERALKNVGEAIGRLERALANRAGANG